MPSLILFLHWVNVFIAVFSIPLFGIGLTSLFRILKNQSSNLEKDLNTIILSWGLLVFSGLTLALIGVST